MMYAFSAGWLDIVPTNQPKVQRVPEYQATERLGGQGAMALDMGAEKSVNCYDTALGCCMKMSSACEMQWRKYSRFGAPGKPRLNVLLQCNSKSMHDPWFVNPHFRRLCSASSPL